MDNCVKTKCGFGGTVGWVGYFDDEFDSKNVILTNQFNLIIYIFKYLLLYGVH